MDIRRLSDLNTIKRFFTRVNHNNSSRFYCDAHFLFSIFMGPAGWWKPQWIMWNVRSEKVQFVCLTFSLCYGIFIIGHGALRIFFHFFGCFNSSSLESFWSVDNIKKVETHPYAAHKTFLCLKMPLSTDWLYFLM